MEIGAKVIKARGNTGTGETGTITEIIRTVVHPKYGELTTVKVSRGGGEWDYFITETDLLDIVQD